MLGTDGWSFSITHYSIVSLHLLSRFVYSYDLLNSLKPKAFEAGRTNIINAMSPGQDAAAVEDVCTSENAVDARRFGT